MPVEHVAKTVSFDQLVVPVSAWRYRCDGCGTVESFADVPMPDGHSEFDASRRGWSIYWDADETELCRCPSCKARR